jgi:hypothetical protein
MTEQEQITKQLKELPHIRTNINDRREQYPYAWWICLDFEEDPVDPIQSHKMCFGWLRHVARFNEAHLAPYVSVEPLHTGKRQSVHVILLSDTYIRQDVLSESWKHGFGYVRQYDPKQLGVEYMFNHHIGFSSHVVCHGKKPCRVNRKGRVFCTVYSQRVLSI